MTNFNSMDLYGPLKKALAEQRYETPTPIQAQTIPPAIAGQDVLGCAQTGTGKTAAFALPILDYLGHERPRAEANRPLALILAPTRELAVQIGDSFRDYGKHIRYQQAVIYGGVGQGAQVNALRRGAHVVIATPGRLIDLMDQGHVDLGAVEILVLDEADRMLDMGFLPALKKIVAKLPEERQSLFFSATLPPKIQELAHELLFNPVFVNVTPKTTSVEKIEQKVRLVARANKMSSLRELLAAKDVQRTIVFTRTKRGANALAQKLDRDGTRAVAIHGNKSQNARQKALDAFRRQQVTVLVATDVAARGIDIEGVTHVVNFDMPVEPESYVHRIGRTGRAEAEGVAISFCTPEERDELRAIEKLIGQRLTVESTDADFAASAASPAKSSRPRNGRPQQNGSRNRGRKTNSRPSSKSSRSRRSSSRRTATVA